MSDRSLKDAMFDTYIYETSKQLENLEQIIMQCEDNARYSAEQIDEIFRIMHTIKGASSMMSFQYIAQLAHSLEDLFSLLRSQAELQVDMVKVSDLVLEVVDYIKNEIEQLGQNGEISNQDTSVLTTSIREYIKEIQQEKNQYVATVFFESSCQMEELRAYELITNLNGFIKDFTFEPDVMQPAITHTEQIRAKGLKLHLKTTKSHEEVYEYLVTRLFVQDVKLEKEMIQKEKVQEPISYSVTEEKKPLSQETKKNNQAQLFTSISFDKLDKIMNLLGEMVVAEVMVLKNPELVGVPLNEFHKAARQLSKITEELQDEIISLRLVSVASVFQKMQRIVREMNKKLGKQVKLKLIGEETEIDKKVVDFITDPIMHIVRNAIDHGIELPEERLKRDKVAEGTVTLEAINDGGEVFINIKDDGKGLNKEAIIKKALANKLITEEEVEKLSDDAIYKLIYKPGFSTKEQTSEFSGRGVGMDVVIKNIEQVGGSIQIKTIPGEGTTFSIKIPLTMAIIDGMTLRVGESYYTIPTKLIKESFRPINQQIVTKPSGEEMLILRGECFPVVRLYEFYNIKTNVKQFSDGIVVRLEQNTRSVCLFVDEIVEQQQVVIKSLPRYILNMKKIKGVSGCTLLGDGRISLILDFESLLS